MGQFGLSACISTRVIGFSLQLTASPIYVLHVCSLVFSTHAIYVLHFPMHVYSEVNSHCVQSGVLRGNLGFLGA